MRNTGVKFWVYVSRYDQERRPNEYLSNLFMCGVDEDVGKPSEYLGNQAHKILSLNSTKSKLVNFSVSLFLNFVFLQFFSAFSRISDLFFVE